jgi:hypothetical protein
MVVPDDYCEECRIKWWQGVRLIREAMDHHPDPDYITLADGQTCHRESQMAREDWLRRQLEGLGKESTP